MSNEITQVINESSRLNTVQKMNKHTLGSVMDVPLSESEIFALKAIKKGVKGIEALCELQIDCCFCPFKGICHSTDMEKIRNAAQEALNNGC